MSSLYARRMQSWRLLAYIGLGVMGALGFWRVELALSSAEDALIRIEEVRADHDRRLCEAGNDRSQVLLDLISRSAAEVAAPPGSPPELVEAFRQSAERGRAFRDYAVSRLTLVDCSAVIAPAPR